MQPKQDSAVGIIPVYTNGEETLFCLIQHAAGHWGFPKGHIDPGESEEQTALREAREEAGITDAKLDTSRVFTESYGFEKNGQQYQKTVRYFLAEVSRTDNVTPDEFKGEIPDMRWSLYPEALELIREQSKPLLEEAQEYLESRP